MIFLKEMMESDLPFFLEVRNECAIEFLHDSRLFTIEESIQWFRTTNPNYYIIEYNNKKNAARNFDPAINNKKLFLLRHRGETH
jgi:hypothetical protein